MRPENHEHVWTVRTPAQAGLYQSVLIAQDITPWLDNEMAMSAAFGETAGGIRIFVPSEDAARAREILEQGVEEREADAGGEA